MFKHKLCENCGRKNHHKNAHCNQCGKSLPEIAILSMKSLVVAVAFLLLAGSGISVASYSLYAKAHVESPKAPPVTIVQPQIQPIKQADLSIATEPTPQATEPSAEEPVQAPTKPSVAPAKAKIEPVSVPSPQVVATPAPVAPAPTCDDVKKTTLTIQYNSDISQATQKRDQAINDARDVYDEALAEAEHKFDDVWDPSTRESLIRNEKQIALSTFNTNTGLANTDYSGTTIGLSAVYNADLKSIHCSN